MNKRVIFAFLLLASILIIVYNKQCLFFLQSKFLSQHHTNSSQHSINQSVLNKSFNANKFFSKVWAHRVNTLERYRYLGDAFQGFEVDVLYDSQNGFFDVGHPPSPSIGLSFEKYLQKPNDVNKLFWMDLKNLDSINVSSVISALDDLDSVYKIKHRVIVESENIEQLSKISLKGYFTSYYYSELSYAKFINHSQSKQDATALDNIDAVSQSNEYNDLLSVKFPSKPRLLWALSINNYLSHSLYNRFDIDTSILVYLVNIKSPYYR